MGSEDGEAKGRREMIEQVGKDSAEKAICVRSRRKSKPKRSGGERYAVQ